MLAVHNLSLSFGKRILFNEVNVKFNVGNCYGLIGANGAGKSSFLKILTNELEASSGEVTKNKNERIAFLEQDQFKYDGEQVIDTVLQGHARLFELIQERNVIYSKEEMTEEEGMKAAELEAEFGDINGYEAESNAGTLLKGLGIEEGLYTRKMGDLEAGQKVRVLLAQAIFGDPDILILDEPTNNLDIKTISWLEDFLINFKNVVILVSHDRHFLNNVCTYIADIDFAKIKLFRGNYELWYAMSQLSMKQLKDDNKKAEDKAEQLKQFIARFSSNASKSKQATSRKKLLEKLTIEDVPKTSRKFPYVSFTTEKEAGKMILNVEGLSKKIDGEDVLRNVSFTLNKGDKVAFLGKNDLSKTTLFQIITGELKPDSGSYKWGETIQIAEFPKENSKFFENDLSLINWLCQYTTIDDEQFIRGFLGRMLFNRDESLKKVNVLSGGEKVRCMLSRMMLKGGNVLILDEPTGHLDLEAITSLNNGMADFKDIILFSSHDHQLVNTVANRLIELTPRGMIDKFMTFDEYMSDKDVQSLRQEKYK